MALILAVETTTEVCSVALGTPENYVLESKRAPRQHNKILIPMIDGVVHSLDIDRSELDCIAFSAGPGSFTGVRIGAAVTQAISLVVGCPVCCVPTSLAMGGRVCKIYNPQEPFQIQRVSRGSLVYQAVLKPTDGSCEFLDSDRLIDREASPRVMVTFDESMIDVNAGDVLLYASSHRANWQKSEQALPIYVEGDHPWKPSQ